MVRVKGAQFAQVRRIDDVDVIDVVQLHLPGRPLLSYWLSIAVARLRRRQLFDVWYSFPQCRSWRVVLDYLPPELLRVYLELNCDPLVGGLTV